MTTTALKLLIAHLEDKQCGLNKCPLREWRILAPTKRLPALKKLPETTLNNLIVTYLSCEHNKKNNH